MTQEELNRVWNHTREKLKTLRNEFRFDRAEFSKILEEVEAEYDKAEVGPVRLTCLACILGPGQSASLYPLVLEELLARSDSLSPTEIGPWIDLVIAYGLDILPRKAEIADPAWRGHWQGAVRAAGRWTGGAIGAANVWLKETVPGYEPAFNAMLSPSRTEGPANGVEHRNALAIYQADGYLVLQRILSASSKWRPKLLSFPFPPTHFRKKLAQLATGNISMAAEEKTGSGIHEVWDAVSGDPDRKRFLPVKGFIGSAYFEYLASEQGEGRRLCAIWSNQEKTTDGVRYSTKQQHVALFLAVIHLLQAWEGLKRNKKPPLPEADGLAGTKLESRSGEIPPAVKNFYDSVAKIDRQGIRNAIEEIKNSGLRLSKEEEAHLSYAKEFFQELSENSARGSFSSNEDGSAGSFRILGTSPLYTLSSWYKCTLGHPGYGEVIYRIGKSCPVCLAHGLHAEDSQWPTLIFEKTQGV